MTLPKLTISELKQLHSTQEFVLSYAKRAYVFRIEDLEALVKLMEEPELEAGDYGKRLVRAVLHFRKELEAIQ